MNRTVIYTINEKEYNKAMKLLYKMDYTWCDREPCNTGWKPDGGVDRLIYLSLYNDDKTITFSTEEPEGNDIISIISLKEFIIQHQLPFTKVDLEDGMVVQTNDGDYYMYFKKFEKFVKEDGYLRLSSYNDNLTNKCNYYDDIKAVFVANNLCTLDLFKEDMNDRLEKIWERPEKVKVYMTISEIEKKLGIENLEIVEE